MPFTKREPEALPPPSGAPREAPGVTYTTVASAGGMKMFRCDAYTATLTMHGCAGRWVEAQTATGWGLDHVERCRGCAIGAAHAGYDVVHYSPWFGSPICPRCGKGGMRMIGNRRCVSCYNRGRELAAGRNARGNAPVELMQRPLISVEILVETDGENVQRVVDRETTGVEETIVSLLRTRKGELVFGRAPGRILTAEEFAAIEAAAAPTAANDTEPDTLWAITASRCLGCSGRIMESAAGSLRCADCGRTGAGRPDAEGEHGAEDEGAAEAGHAVDPLRARLFASTALVSARSVQRALSLPAVRTGLGGGAKKTPAAVLEHNDGGEAGERRERSHSARDGRSLRSRRLRS
jgi:hypothetical protein